MPRTDLTRLFHAGPRNSAADRLRAQGWQVAVTLNMDAYRVNDFEPPADHLTAMVGDSGYLSAELG